MMTGKFLAFAAAFAALTAGAPGAISSAQAQYQIMSCDQLWYERNLIYAERGFCFKTRRARNVFGPRCYPPHGRLTSGQRQDVAAIKRWEKRKGCRR